MVTVLAWVLALGAINLSTLQLANDMRSGGLVGALTDLKKHLVDSGATASQQETHIATLRTGIELTVLVTGYLLGGSVGLGTVVYALGIGPLAHTFMPRLAIQPASS